MPCHMYYGLSSLGTHHILCMGVASYFQFWNILVRLRIGKDTLLVFSYNLCCLIFEYYMIYTNYYAEQIATKNLRDADIFSRQLKNSFFSKIFYFHMKITMAIFLPRTIH